MAFPSVDCYDDNSAAPSIPRGPLTRMRSAPLAPSHHPTPGLERLQHYPLPGALTHESQPILNPNTRTYPPSHTHLYPHSFHYYNTSPNHYQHPSPHWFSSSRQQNFIYSDRDVSHGPHSTAVAPNGLDAPVASHVSSQSTYVATHVHQTAESVKYHNSPHALHAYSMPPPQQLDITPCGHYSPGLDTFSPTSVMETPSPAHNPATPQQFYDLVNNERGEPSYSALDMYEPPQGYGELPANIGSSENEASGQNIDYASIPIPANAMAPSPHPMQPLERVRMKPFRKPSTYRRYGRRRAMLVGISYSGPAQLTGPVNDVVFIKYLLRSKFGFAKEDIRIYTDSVPDLPGYPLYSPTREGILDGMRWLVDGAEEGDSLWFSFSGHGSQIEDYNNDEWDGKDEALLPVDYATAGYIVDDEIHDILVRGTPAGARLTALFDACHCGSGMDLPCEYEGDGHYKYTGRRFGDRLIRPAHSHSSDPEAASGCVHLDDPERLSYNRVGEVILFSGCQDDQLSAENHNGASTTGVMTYTLIKGLEWISHYHPHCSYLQLMEYMKDVMRRVPGCEQQTPQLSTAFPFDLNSEFCI